MKRGAAILITAFAASALAAAEKYEWQASPRVTVELIEHRYALITVTNVEARDICRNLTEWPGANGRLTNDDFRVRGRLDPAWHYVGAMIYPSRELLRTKPGESISARVDLLQYYRSDREGDEIIDVEWLNSGFVYCDYAKSAH